MAGARMLMVNSQMRAAATSVTGNGGKRSMSGQIALSMVRSPFLNANESQPFPVLLACFEFHPALMGENIG